MLAFLLIFNTFILLGFLTSEMAGNVVHETIRVNLTRVIDGDTIDSDYGRVRLLGINTPEKNQPYYEQAREFLKQYERKIVEMEERGQDKYDRVLGYIYYQEKLINSEILGNGLANLYVYDKDEHYSELKQAEEEARDNGRGIWKKSRNYGCVEVVEFEPIDKTEKDKEKLILRNSCSISLSIIIKDDANHIYNEKILPGSVLSMDFQNIFNDDGDSLIIRDSSGLLLFYRY